MRDARIVSKVSVRSQIIGSPCFSSQVERPKKDEVPRTTTQYSKAKRDISRVMERALLAS